MKPPGLISSGGFYPIGNLAAAGDINYKRLLNQNKYKRATAYPTKTGFVKDIFTHVLLESGIHESALKNEWALQCKNCVFKLDVVE